MTGQVSELEELSRDLITTEQQLEDGPKDLGATPVNGALETNISNTHTPRTAPSETYIPDASDEVQPSTEFDEAVKNEREILESTIPGTEDYALSLDRLGTPLRERFDATGRIRDINEAIFCARENLKLRPPGHVSYRNSLRTLSIYLFLRFEKTTNIEDIKEALDCGRMVLELCPPGHTSRADGLIQLCVYLRQPSDVSGRPDDVEEAINLGREALRLCSPGHPERQRALRGSGMTLAKRFDRTGMLEDLDEEVRILQELLSIAPIGHVWHNETIIDLAEKLRKRFEVTGRVGDLREEIQLRQQMRDENPPESLDSPNPVHPLVRKLCAHLKSTKTTDPELVKFAIRCGEDYLLSIEDLDEEIILRKELVELCPSEHELRADTLENLAASLHIRFKRDGKLEDLQEEIQRRQQLRSGGDSSRSASTYLLIQKLYTLLAAKKMTSLERKFAIDCGQACLDSLSAMDVRRVKLRYQLKSVRGVRA